MEIVENIKKNRLSKWGYEDIPPREHKYDPHRILEQVQIKSIVLFF